MGNATYLLEEIFCGKTIRIFWIFQKHEIRFPFWPPKGSNPRKSFHLNVSKSTTCKLRLLTIQKSRGFLSQLPSTITFIVYKTESTKLTHVIVKTKTTGP